MRHDDGRGEEHQQQGAPGAFLQWRMQRGECGLVLQQPQLQFTRPAEHAIEGIQADAAQADQFDHRLEGDGEHQAFVFLAGGDMACAKKDGEQRDQGAEGKGEAVLQRLTGEDADGVGHGLDLQGQQRQHADQHEQGGQGAGPTAAEAKGEQVGQRGQLVGAGDAQDRIQQHRGEQEGAGNTQVAGEEPEAVLVGQADRAVERPGTGIDTQRQGVGQRMTNHPAGDQALLADPGHAEQH